MTESMTSKERVLAALKRKETDLVPVHHLGFSSDVASALLGREAYVGGGIQQWREAVAHWNGEDAHTEFLERSFRDALDVAVAAGNDVIRPNYWRHDRKPTRRIDENTFDYEYGSEAEWEVLRYDPGSEQCNIMPYKPRPVDDPVESAERDVLALEQSLESDEAPEKEFAFEIHAKQAVGDRYEIRVGGNSLGLPLFNLEAWLTALPLRPDLVNRLLDAQVERARRNITFLAPLGFRHFWGGTDLASNTGPFYSPRTLEELLVPRFRAITEICHAHDACHFFASDGDLWPVADMIFVDQVVDGYYEIDGRAGMDMHQLRDRYPNLILIGNISSHTVHLGSKEEIVDEALRAIEVAKESGGVIVGVSNYLVPHTPIDNVLTLLQTIKENR